MAMSNSRLAFSDCYELLEKAMADPKGIRVKFETEEDAWLFRLRLHNARKIDRRENEENFEKGHGMYGKSLYDTLVMRLRQVKDSKAWWLMIEKLSIDHLEIESLAGADRSQELKPTKLPLADLIIPPIVTVQPIPFKRRI